MSKCGSAKLSNSIYHSAGNSHSCEPVEAQMFSDVQHRGTKGECLSQPVFTEVTTFAGSWQGSPGSHSLLAMPWPSPCPHKEHEENPFLVQVRNHLSRTSTGITAEQNIQLPICFYPPRNKFGQRDPYTRLSHALDPWTTLATLHSIFMASLQLSHQTVFLKN